MKEMLGGCCVCSDENGWAGNPLVYCDGPECEVAVHQGCYGILEVPEGEWLCAKCQVAANGVTPKPNGVIDVARNGGGVPPRCELCPFGYGALKRTDKNSWAHVICALYIPEVKFGDVHSMDPVILDDVPQDRFDRVCYLCEDESAPKAAKVGACMNCNKSGCKKSFHVTCAQRRGLLCEEGGVSKNVKYCGYCAHHLKKAATDSSIKIVPPCKVRPLASSSERGSIKLTSSIKSSKYSSSSSSLLNGGYSSSAASTPKREDKMMIDQIPRPEPTLGSTLLTSSTSTECLLQSGGSTTFSPPLTSSSRSSLVQEGATPPLKESSLHLNGHSLPGPSTSSASSTISTPPSSSIPLGGSATVSPPTVSSSPSHTSSIFNTNGSSTLNLSSASSHHLTNHNRLLDSSSPLSTHSNSSIHLPPPPSVAPPPSTSSSYSSRINGLSSTPSTSSSTVPLSSLVVSAPPTTVSSSPSSECTPNHHHHPNIHPSVSGNLPVGAAIAAGLVTPKVGSSVPPSVSTKRAAKGDLDGKSSKRARNSHMKTQSVRELLDAVEPLVSATVSDFQRERAANKADAAERSRIQQLAADTAYAMGAQRANSLLAAAAQHMDMKQQQQQMDIKPNIAPSTSSSVNLPSMGESMTLSSGVSHPSGSIMSGLNGGGIGTSNGPQGVPATMEELLERQWEQGSSFVIANSQFDVAQLISCLHNLKKENGRLEEALSTMTKRRDHLLALNARLAMPLGVTAASAANTNGQQSTNNSHGSSLQLSAPLHPGGGSSSSLISPHSRKTPSSPHIVSSSIPSIPLPPSSSSSSHQPPPSSIHSSTPSINLPSLSTPSSIPSSLASEDSLQQLRSLAAGRSSATTRTTPSSRSNPSNDRFNTPSTPTVSQHSSVRTPVTSSSSSFNTPSLPLAPTPTTSSPSFNAPSLLSLQNPSLSDLERTANSMSATLMSNPTLRQAVLSGSMSLDMLSLLFQPQQQQLNNAASLLNQNNTAALLNLMRGGATSGMK